MILLLTKRPSIDILVNCRDSLKLQKKSILTIFKSLLNKADFENPGTRLGRYISVCLSPRPENIRISRWRRVGLENSRGHSSQGWKKKILWSVRRVRILPCYPSPFDQGLDSITSRYRNVLQLLNSCLETPGTFVQRQRNDNPKVLSIMDKTLGHENPRSLESLYILGAFSGTLEATPRQNHCSSAESNPKRKYWAPNIHIR